MTDDRDEGRERLEYPKTLKPWDLEPHYCRHVVAMTSEELHSKHDIAKQLAWRDQQIERLKVELEASAKDRDDLKEARELLAGTAGYIAERTSTWKDIVEFLKRTEPKP